jgi:adenine-specific DNA glycosylase
MPEQIPPARRRAAPKVVHHHAVIVQRGRDGAVLLVQRSSKSGMWSGMWETPTVENATALDAAEIRARLPLRVSALIRRGEFTHHTTHRTIRFHVYHAKSRARRGLWRAVDRVSDLPLSNAQARVLTFARVN